MVFICILASPLTLFTKHVIITSDNQTQVIIMIIDIIQIVSAIALIIVIILQNRGSGLGSAFGGSGGVYHTRRSIEKVLFQLTIVLSIVFFVTAFINILF